MRETREYQFKLQVIEINLHYIAFGIRDANLHVILAIAKHLHSSLILQLRLIAVNGQLTTVYGQVNEMKRTDKSMII